MASSRKPHKQHPIREHWAYSLVVGAAIGGGLAVIVIGRHLSEWPVSKSLANILAAAVTGLLFGCIATNFPRSSKPNSGNRGTTNDSASIDSGSYFDGGGHSDSHGGGNDCGSDGGGGDCGGGD